MSEDKEGIIRGEEEGTICSGRRVTLIQKRKMQIWMPRYLYSTSILAVLDSYQSRKLPSSELPPEAQQRCVRP